MENEEKAVMPEPEKMLIEVTPIEETPFNCVRYEDQYFLALGKYRLTGILPTKEAVLEEVKNTSWERLLSVMYAVAKSVVEGQTAKAEALKDAIKLNISKS